MERDGNWAIAIVDPHSKVERWLRSRDSSSLSEVQPPYLCFDWVEDVRDKTSLTHPYIGGLRVSELRKRDYKKVHVEFKHDKYAKFPMCTAVEHQNSPQRPKRVHYCSFCSPHLFCTNPEHDPRPWNGGRAWRGGVRLDSARRKLACVMCNNE